MAGVHPIVRLLSTDPKLVIGLISGTSLDGVDAALVEVTGHGAAARVRLRRFLSLPFPPGLQKEVEKLLDPRQPSSAADLSTVNFRLGQAFADAAAQVAGDDVVDLIGSHGQTVWHQPPWMKERVELIASTLQLGEPAVIAARMGAVTVGDFRVADVAVSGEGAPLVPYADWVLFRRPGAVRALQNIGGIANVTIVSDRLSDVFAFDNGPGNMVIDALARHATNGAERYDRDGLLSAAGRVLPELLAQLLDDDYLCRPPPKSTGRERYGRSFADRLVREHPRARPLDLLATAVFFTAESIAQSYRAFVFPRVESVHAALSGSPGLARSGRSIEEVVVSGGGVHNRTLMAHLAELLAPVPVREFNDGGIPADAKEAVAFALLAVETIHASPANVPAATGARRAAVLGKICLPPP